VYEKERESSAFFLEIGIKKRGKGEGGCGLMWIVEWNRLWNVECTMHYALTRCLVFAVFTKLLRERADKTGGCRWKVEALSLI
jgi:hypothetical protein